METTPQPYNLAYQDQVIHSPSWGAGAFGPVYLLAMRAYPHGIIFLSAGAILAASLLSPQLAQALGWLPAFAFGAMWIGYAFSGKRIAWRTRAWRDFADFLACQRVWDRWGRRVVAVAAALVGLDWALRTYAPPRGLRARALFDEALLIVLGGAGGVLLWWYRRRYRSQLRSRQRLGLSVLIVLGVVLCVFGVFRLFQELWMPDVADIVLVTSMMLAGVIAAVLAARYARSHSDRPWLWRVIPRLLVLPAALVAAAGMFGLLQHFGVSEDALGIAMVALLALTLVAVLSPPLWHRHETGSLPQPLKPVWAAAVRRGHLRAAWDAVVLMVRRPILLLPFLVSTALQAPLRSLLVMPDISPKNPEIFWPAVLPWFARMFIISLPLYIVASATTSMLAAQVEAGRTPSPGSALRRALVRLPASFVMHVLIVVRVVVGFMLLIVPGVVGFVRWALTPQAVVLGYAGPLRAFGVSHELARGHWWRMFLLIVLEFVVATTLSITLARIPVVGTDVAAWLDATWVTITLSILYVRLGGPVQETAPTRRDRQPALTC